MKKLLIAAAAAAFVTAPAFAASSDTESFDINAEVAQTCTMENVNDINLGNLSINTSAGSSALIINGVDTGSTGSFWLSCNDTNNMTISSQNSGRLKNITRTYQPGVDDAGFKDTINYSLGAENYRNGGALAQPAFRRTLFGLVSINQGTNRGAIHKQVNIGALVDPLNNIDGRPLAGVYQDLVTVTVTTI